MNLKQCVKTGLTLISYLNIDLHLVALKNFTRIKSNVLDQKQEITNLSKTHAF